jgi:hypothetical protein
MRHHRKTLLDLTEEIERRIVERQRASRISDFGFRFLRRHCQRLRVWVVIGDRRLLVRSLRFCRAWLAMDSEREAKGWSREHHRADQVLVVAVRSAGGMAVYDMETGRDRGGGAQ